MLSLRGMPHPRTSALIVGALVTGGLAVFWNTTRTADAPVEASVSIAETIAAKPVNGGVVHFWSEPEQPLPIAARAANMRRVAPATLGGAETALIAEQAALQLLAKDADLDLSPRQWAAFAKATSHIQAVRQAYEASVAKVSVVEGRHRLEIPAYPAAGDALRVKFQAELREQLGPATCAEILSLLGAALEGHFAGFGVSVQTLDFIAAGGAQDDIQVTRTVQYWNAVSGENRLTTRRETHFPRQEDPNGETWGPFLAVLSAGARERIGG